MSKQGYGSYKEILDIPVHILLRHYKWFINNRKEELKAKQEYDISLLKAGCPLFRGK